MQREPWQYDESVAGVSRNFSGVQRKCCIFQHPKCVSPASHLSATVDVKQRSAECTAEETYPRVFLLVLLLHASCFASD